MRPRLDFKFLGFGAFPPHSIVSAGEKNLGGRWAFQLGDTAWLECLI